MLCSSLLLITCLLIALIRISVHWCYHCPCAEIEQLERNQSTYRFTAKEQRRQRCWGVGSQVMVCFCRICKKLIVWVLCFLLCWMFFSCSQCCWSHGIQGAVVRDALLWRERRGELRRRGRGRRDDEMRHG